MPETFLRSKRAVAVAVAAIVVGASAAVLLSGQRTTARAAVAPGETVRASVADGADGAQAPDGGANQELSSDGTAVVFTSDSKLEDLDPAGYQNVYVRDLRRGRTVMISRGQLRRPEPPPTTTTPPDTFDPPHLTGDPLLSLNGAQPPELEFGDFPPNGSSYQPSISGDGRYVAFVTQADNVVPEDDDGDLDLLVCDRDPDDDGEFDEEREGGGRDYEYFRVNQPTWEDGDGDSYRTDFPSYPRLSDDASRIVWEDEYDPQEAPHRYVVRTAALRAPGGGAVGPPGTVEIVDTSLEDDVQPTRQSHPDVSGDGRYIVLVADYFRVAGEAYVQFQAVIRKDTVTGAVLRVDWDINTTPTDITYLSADESTSLTSPSISSNGGEIAFETEELRDTCSEGCWNSVADQPTVFVVRIAPDALPVDSIVASRDNDNEIINGFSPALSGDGRFLAFGTDNLNAHDGVDTAAGTSSCVNFNPMLRGKPMVDLSGPPPTSEDRNQRTVCQIVVRDLVVDRQRLVNEEPRQPGTLASTGGGEETGNDDSPPNDETMPSLSHNGSTIAYDSAATNLVPGDDNKRTDVFVRTFRPELRADPTPLDFGPVELGDAFDKVVRFDHVGTGPLVVTDIAVDGSDEFAIGAQTCRGEAVVLQQTGNCEVSVTFLPTTEGDASATLRLTLRDGREFTVPLLGKGSVEKVPPDGPRFAAGPDPLNFGDRLLLSEGPTQVVTVTNVGDLPLTVTGVAVVSTLAQADYTITANTCSVVPANGTCQVTVRFSPTASGDRQAVLRFTDDAPGSDAHLIGLTGKGSTPNIEVSPGVTPPARVVMVTGTGFAPNLPVTITLTGGVEKVTAVANDTGAFTQSLLVLPKSPIGSRPMVATIDGTTLTAARPLLVVTPSVSPSEFVGRG